MVTTSSAYGDSLCHVWLQPLSHMVTASAYYLGGEDGGGARVARAVEQVVQVAAEAVCILLEHASHVVHHLPRVVTHLAR